MIKKALYSVFLLLCCIYLPCAQAEEKITLSTFYPAPHGEYDYLAANSMVVGRTYPFPVEDNLIVEGSVGIGTMEPGNKLTIENTGTVTQSLQNTASNDGTYARYLLRNDGTAYADFIEYSSGSTRTLFGNSVANRAMLYAAGASSEGLLLGSYTAKPLILGTNKAERMRIDSDGNVGIGTTSPNGRFHIANNVLFDPTDGVYNDRSIVLHESGGSTGEHKGAIVWGSGNRKRAAITSVAESADSDIVGLAFWTQRTDGPGSISESVRISRSGNVGIGTTAPSYKLTVNGTAWCSAGAWTGSDIRWKENIAALPDPLEKLLKIRGVEFDWRRAGFKDSNFPEGRQIGIIAQELEKEYPELVATDKDGYKAIAYDRLSAVLLEAIKSQQKEINSLKARIDALETEL